MSAHSHHFLRLLSCPIAFFLCATGSGCFYSPRQDEGDADIDDHQLDSSIDENPTVYPECPTGEPHLGIVLSSNSGDGQLVRVDSRLRLCRGVVFADEVGDPTGVAGTSAGYDAVGTNASQVLLFDGSAQLWAFQFEPYRTVMALFTMDFEGEETLGVLWGDGYGGDTIMLLDLGSGDILEEYEVGSSVIHTSAMYDGAANKIAAIIEWDGVQEYRAEPNAETLGTTGERLIAAPYTDLNWLEEGHGRLYVAGDDGVLYLPPESMAFLGPVACRWPATATTPILDGEERYWGVVPDLDDPESFLVIAIGALEGFDTSSTHLVWMTTHNECSHILVAPDSMVMIGLDWSGVDL